MATPVQEVRPFGYLLSSGEKRSARGFLGVVVGRVLRVCKHNITGPGWDRAELHGNWGTKSGGFLGNAQTTRFGKGCSVLW